MGKITALIILLLILGTSLYAFYQGALFPLFIKPMLKPKDPSKN